jgi:F-type H+-transporting ATPase subunit alpha
VLQVFAATNGFLDRITVARVAEFLTGLVEHAHAHHKALRKKIAAGEWSDEIQEEVRKAVGDYADGFGYDLDEDGQPIDQEADPLAQNGKSRETKRPAGEDEPDNGKAAQPAKAPEEEGAPA